MTEERRLFALHAHPDDESSKGAGTMARVSAEGGRVVVVCCTGGEAGEILNPRMDRPGVRENIAEWRREEMNAACAILGVRDVYWLGYRDSGMPGSPDNQNPAAFCNADPEEVLERLVAIIRKERPQVVLGYDEARGYEHPDHIRVHELGIEAFHAAGDRDRFPDAGEAWRPLKLYYFASFSKQRISALHEGVLGAGMESPYTDWLEEWGDDDRAEPKVTCKVDVSDYIDLRSKALLAHATQIDPDGHWLAIPDDLQRDIYPWEDYRLIISLVETDEEETDLFAGIS